MVSTCLVFPLVQFSKQYEQQISGLSFVQRVAEKYHKLEEAADSYIVSIISILQNNQKEYSRIEILQGLKVSRELYQRAQTLREKTTTKEVGHILAIRTVQKKINRVNKLIKIYFLVLDGESYYMPDVSIFLKN